MGFFFSKVKVLVHVVHNPEKTRSSQNSFWSRLRTPVHVLNNNFLFSSIQVLAFIHKDVVVHILIILCLHEIFEMFHGRVDTFFFVKAGSWGLR